MREMPEFKPREEKVFQGINPFEDHRGKIDNYELPESINLLATITSKAGTIRANHFHPIQEQKCLVISGSYISIYKDLMTPDSPIKHQLIKAGDLSIMPPMISHTMIFPEDCVFLNLVNGNRDHDKFGEHTIKHELVKPEEVHKYIEMYKKKIE